MFFHWKEAGLQVLPVLPASWISSLLFVNECLIVSCYGFQELLAGLEVRNIVCVDDDGSVLGDVACGLLCTMLEVKCAEDSPFAGCWSHFIIASSHNFSVQAPSKTASWQ